VRKRSTATLADCVFFKNSLNLFKSGYDYLLSFMEKVKTMSLSDKTKPMIDKTKPVIDKTMSLF